MAVFNPRGRRIWVAGGGGMLGSALERRLSSMGVILIRSDRRSLDLRNQAKTLDWISKAGLDAILLCAATVGGINANRSRPAEFIADNLSIQTNVIDGAHKANVNRLVFFGSSCMYPRAAPQPIREDALLTGPLEPTNEPYAIAKLAGASLVKSYRQQYSRAYITVVPTNLYGPGDDFTSGDGHVIAAMIDRFHRAKVEDRPSSPIWGTGAPRREFLFVEDAAEATVHLLREYDDPCHINIAGGEERSILELAREIAQIVGYDGPIVTDDSYPDGMPLKALEGSRIREMGWQPRTRLVDGLRLAYEGYKMARGLPVS